MYPTQSDIEKALHQPDPPWPEYPRIRKIFGEPYTDSLGDQAVRVWVVLSDDTPDRDRQAWPQLRPIEQAVRERLNRAGIEAFPYIEYVKREHLPERLSS